MAERPQKQKSCSRCGKPFICGPVTNRIGGGCEDLPRILPFTGEDCRCPDCSEAEIERLEQNRARQKTCQARDPIHTEKGRPPRRRPAKEPVVLNWSGGKDSAMALYHLCWRRKDTRSSPC